MPVRLILFLTILSFIPGIVEAESNTAPGNYYATLTVNSFSEIDFRQNDSVPDVASPAPDTVAVSRAADYPAKDSADNSLAAGDTASIKPGTKKGMLEDEVTYTSDDSMFIDLSAKMLYLYGNAQVKYQNIELLADYIILDMGNQEVFAKGIPDSTGKVTKLPKFTQGSQTFDSDSLRYNFNTKNGIIYHIRTKEGEGFLHSETTKRFSNEHIHLQNGKYTTCDADHPHFYLALTKGIVVPDDKIITGYAYMVIADIPIRMIGIPFGFFPNTEDRTSGILMPTYGQEATRGMFLRDFGWYQVLGEYADLTIRGDVYSRGSWAIRNALGYKWRYHFSGNLGFNYAVNTDTWDTDFPETYDYAIRWRHTQDGKANPTQNFSANVNFTSRRFDQNHSYSSSEYLNSTTSSSISFSKRWPSTPFNLSLSANATQNRQTEKVDVSLPSGSFNMSSIYPFRSKAGSGKYKWYENVSLTYSSSFRNELSTYQDVLFKPETWDSLKNGFRHSIPLAVNFKIGKLINITPSMSYTGVLFSRHKEIADDPYYDTLTGDFVYDVTEYNNLRYEQAFNPNISVSFNPKLYGMLVSSKEDSYVEAIRHVMTPSAGFSYTPDMQGINNMSYYDTVFYTNEEGERDVARTYSWYEDEDLFDPPSSNGQNGSLRLSLNNNLEMKVRPRNDTTGESKKVVLLDNLNFSTSYNPFADSLRWSDLRLVTGTKLFNKKLDLRVNGAFTPYGVNETTGAKINEFFIQQEGGSLLRLTNLSVNTSFTLQSKQGQKKGEQASDDIEDAGYSKGTIPYDGTELDDDMNNMGTYEPESYVDFDIPWSLSVRHSWSYTRRGLADPTISNTLNLSGDVSFTSKWKVGGQMNYDIENREMSYTSLSIFRDLHCWEMRFSVIPFGDRKSYSFTIQAKGSLLRDLKYEKKPNWYDNFL